jgi:hypothetical protein
MNLEHDFKRVLQFVTAALPFDWGEKLKKRRASLNILPFFFMNITKCGTPKISILHGL